MVVVVVGSSRVGDVAESFIYVCLFVGFLAAVSVLTTSSVLFLLCLLASCIIFANKQLTTLQF